MEFVDISPNDAGDYRIIKMKCPKCGKEMLRGKKTWICKDCTVLLRE